MPYLEAGGWWLALLGEVMDSNYSQDGDQSLTAL
jgi:hypothetical protein